MFYGKAVFYGKMQEKGVKRMTLGKRISTYRTARRLSQEEVAEHLAVSRQAVSKWETDRAVPELDKLVALSDLFGVTLDQLVKGEEEPLPPSDAPPPGGTGDRTEAPAKGPWRPSSTRCVIGALLLCFGGAVTLWLLLHGVGLLFSLILGGPLLLCGGYALVVRRHLAVWCVWTVFLAIDLYLRAGTGITWRMVFQTVGFQPGWNYLRLAMGWGLFLSTVVCALVTIRSFPQARCPSRRVLFATAAGCVGLVCLRRVAFLVLFRAYAGVSGPLPASYGRWAYWLGVAGDYLVLAALLPLVIWAWNHWRERRRAGKADKENPLSE